MTRKTFYFLLFTFCFLPLSLFSQKVEVLERGEATNLKKQTIIEYLYEEPEEDNRIFFVATLKASGFEDVAQLFDAVRFEAGRMGANCFRLEEYVPDENNSSLTLRTYFALQDYLSENDQLKERNVIYVFGNDKSDDGNISFKINGKKTKVKSREYFRYENGIGERAKISKGGFMGASVAIDGAENKPATYLTVSGFGLAPAGGYVEGHIGSVAYSGFGVGISIATGKINYISPNLANLLLLIWKESE